MGLGLYWICRKKTAWNDEESQFATVSQHSEESDESWRTADFHHYEEDEESWSSFSEYSV
jgi:hypothetical protein